MIFDCKQWACEWLPNSGSCTLWEGHKWWAAAWPPSSFHSCPQSVLSREIGQLHTFRAASNLQHSSKREYQIHFSLRLLVIKGQRCPACLWFLLLVFSTCFIPFNHSNTCSLALCRAAGDEQAGRVRLRRKDLFHLGLLWEHRAPLINELKTSGGCIRSCDCI